MYEDIHILYNSLYSRRLQTARQVFVKIKLSTYKLIENLGNYLYIQPTVLQTIFQVSDIKTSMEGKTQKQLLLVDEPLCFNLATL